MVEAIVTSAQPLQFFFFFPMLFSSIRLVMCKEFRGNTLFFGIPEKTQREIAQKLSISRSYVSRIEKNALRKLRTLFPEKQ